jgi:hypothetical protein
MATTYGSEYSDKLRMYRGDTYTRKLVVVQDGQVYNIKRHIVRMTFKWSLSDVDNSAVFVLSSNTSGITLTNPSSGEFQFTISPSHTLSLPPHRVDLYFDAQITDTNNNIYTVYYGILTVLPESSITAS